MKSLLERYRDIVGEAVIEELRALSAPMEDLKVVHVNSTRVGGGVAEILDSLIPLKRELGLDASWEVVEGEGDFFNCTKAFHNTIQGDALDIPDSWLRAYEDTNRLNAERLGPVLANADFVIIHDPQPLPLVEHCRRGQAPWVWRCHIDASRPHPPVWRYLRPWVERYDASIWSLSDFVQPLPHPTCLIPPSIDPTSVKNRDMDGDEVASVVADFGLDPDRPLITQVSRYDRFKDPVGVIKAWKLVREHLPLQLVLVGGGATDDPEGEVVLAEVREAAAGHPDVHVLVLPPDAHRTINALQRASDVILQKSTKEGFGLTVTEGLWKGRPVIGGDVGGIRLQIRNEHNGYLVSSPEEAAERVLHLLKNPAEAQRMGGNARESVRERFLLTRHLNDYLLLMRALLDGSPCPLEHQIGSR